LRALFAGLCDENVCYSLKCRCLPDPHSQSATFVDHIRLFRNHPAVRWSYRVHEQILPAVRNAGGAVRAADAVVTHTGYTDPALRRRKLERDLRLLTFQQQDMPDEPFTLFYLGMVNLDLGDHAVALPHLKRSLELSAQGDSIVRKLYSLLADGTARAGDLRGGLGWCEQGLTVCPDDPELLFVQALMRTESGDLRGARASLLRLLAVEAQVQFASVAEGLRTFKARHQLGVVCFRLGEHDAAEALWRRCVAERPDSVLTWVALCELCRLQQRWADAEAAAAALAALPDGAAEAAHMRAACARDRGGPPAPRGS
jgi:tetratricopeptide (TPR) repeat protein